MQIQVGESNRKSITSNKKLLYDHTKFNEAIEILTKMLDRLDHYDRMFAQE